MAGDVIQGCFPPGARVPERMNALPPVMAGSPLPPAVRQKMESFFGTSFADVRVHVGPQAAAIGALAFTRGSHIHFAPGQYDPHLPRGQRILGHELAHVVQQRARRVTNPFGSGTAVVVDSVLEAEAERRGREATTVQPLMSHVMSYLRHHPDAGLDGVNYETVKAYVENESANPIHRRAIWHAWHQRGTRKQQRQTREIALPEDLEPKNLLKPAVAVDLSGWDSDDEAIDIGGSLRAVPVVTLVRGDGTTSAVKCVDRAAVIKLGRQITKEGIRGSKWLPFVGDYGNGYLVEFDSPGTEDIYAYPLKKEKLCYRRAGTSRDFNWANIAAKLDLIAKTPGQRVAKRQKIVNEFRGGGSALSGEEVEAVAAIACDFFKGSGNRQLVAEVVALGEQDHKFSEIFAGPKPKYRPAISGGRKLAREATVAEKSKKRGEKRRRED